MLGILEKGTRLDMETLAETKSYSASANFTFDNDMPRDKDILGIGCEVTAQVDSGTGVTKLADNIFQMIAELNTRFDGQPLLSLYDVELKWLHWLTWGRKPDVKETPDATGQSNASCWMRFMLPVMIPRNLNPNASLTVKGKWGAMADLDSGTNFNIDSATLKLTVYKGRLNKTQRGLGFYYTRRHSPTAVNGDGEKTIPAGLLRAIIAQTTDRSDSFDTFSLAHGGHYFINDQPYEELRAYMNWKWGITLEKEGDPDAEETTGLVVLDGQGLPVAGSNTKIYYKTTASKNLYLLYYLRGHQLRA